MIWLREKKWMIGCIAKAIVLLILVVNSMALYRQIDKLRMESVLSLNAEWHQLYRLSEMVDKYYIKDNFENPIRYQLLVNQTAHHFMGRADELSNNMKNLLVLA